MTKSTRVAGAALALGAVLLASACESGGSGTPSSSSAPSSSSTTSVVSTPSSSPATTSDPNSPQARSSATLNAYFKVHDSCMSDPQSAAMTCFDGVAIGTELDNLRNALSSAKTAYTKQIGGTTVVWAKQTKIDLTNKPKETPPSIPIVTYSVCYDVSKVNIVDYQGKSILPPDRKPRAVETVAVANYQYPKPTGWRVAYTQPTEKTC